MAKRIILTCWGSYGDVLPFVGVAKALLERGHHPVLIAPARDRAAVEKMGIECCALAGDAQQLADLSLTQKSVVHKTVDTVRPLYRQLEELAKDADCLISHSETYATRLFAEKYHKPWVSVTLIPMTFLSITDPPNPTIMGSRFFRPLEHCGPWFPKLMKGLARRVTQPMMRPIYDFRAELGLPRGGHPMQEGQFSPFLHLALYDAVLGVPQPDWPPNTVQAGFMFTSNPTPISSSLRQFLEAPGQSKPIVVSLGSSLWAKRRFYEETLNALKALGRRAIILTGGLYHSDSHPDTFYLTDYAPHDQLFPHASLIVHHGGMGTSAQALRAGVPQLVVPHAHDQPDNAARIERLGVSRTLYPGQYRAARVEQELKTLLSDQSFAQNAQCVASKLLPNGAEIAATAILEMLNRASV
jgi:rhamnosyltransferase subunit B